MDSIKKDDHVYKLITNLEQVEYYDKSLACYNNKTTGEELDRWTAVKKRIDKKNFRITHFSIYPMLMSLIKINLNNFYMCCGIVKSFFLCLRVGLKKKPVKLKDGFANKLLKFWNAWQVSMLENNKKFNCLQEKDINVFLTKWAAAIGKWVESHMKKGKKIFRK